MTFTIGRWTYLLSWRGFIRVRRIKWADDD